MRSMLFRLRDLALRPGPEEMMRDAVYRDFVRRNISVQGGCSRLIC